MSTEDALRSLLVAATADDVDAVSLARIEQTVARQRRVSTAAWAGVAVAVVAVGAAVTMAPELPTSSVPASAVSGPAVGGVVLARGNSGLAWSGVTVACLGLVAGAGALVVLLGVVRGGRGLLGRAAAAVAWVFALAGGAVLGSVLANIAMWVPVLGSAQLRAGGWNTPVVMAHLGWSRLAGGLALATAASLALTLLDAGVASHRGGRPGGLLRLVLLVTMAPAAGVAAADIAEFLTVAVVGHLGSAGTAYPVLAGRLGPFLLIAAGAAFAAVAAGAGAGRRRSLTGTPGRNARSAAADVFAVVAGTACSVIGVDAALALRVVNGTPHADGIRAVGHVLVGESAAAAVLAVLAAVIAAGAPRGASAWGRGVAAAVAVVLGAVLSLPAVPDLPRLLHAAWPTAWANAGFAVVAAVAIGVWCADLARRPSGASHRGATG